LSLRNLPCHGLDCSTRATDGFREIASVAQSQTCLST
jgi:hypothetical protein